MIGFLGLTGFRWPADPTRPGASIRKAGLLGLLGLTGLWIAGAGACGAFGAFSLWNHQRPAFARLAWLGFLGFLGVPSPAGWAVGLFHGLRAPDCAARSACP